MATAENNSGSILGALADHESELLAKLEASTTEAQDIVEQARSQARGVLQKSDADLAEEVATIRRDAQDLRDAAFRKTVEAAQSELEGAQAAAFERVPATAKQVLALLLPDTSEGAST